MDGRASSHLSCAAGRSGSLRRPHAAASSGQALNRGRSGRGVRGRGGASPPRGKPVEYVLKISCTANSLLFICYLLERDFGMIINIRLRRQPVVFVIALKFKVWTDANRQLAH